jgi:hypothetical protein
MAYSYDRSSGFKGPFPLSEENVKADILDNYGVYLLVTIKSGLFSDDHDIEYVGRGHLRTRLRKRIGKYHHFYYKVANNEYSRFRIECEEFHRYGKANKLHNKIHPAKPSGDHPLCTELGCNGESY